MITALPIATPLTIPFVLPTVAYAVLPLIHVPPGTPSDNVVVPVEQTLDEPLIAGAEFTVTIEVAIQPPVPVGINVIVAVPPDTPVTTPPVPTEAIPVLLLLQAPVPDDSDSVEPGHIAPLLPVMPGAGVIVTVVVVIQPPVPNV